GQGLSTRAYAWAKEMPMAAAGRTLPGKAFAQGGTLAGIMGHQAFEVYAGWRDPASFGEHLSSGVATLIDFYLGGKMADRFLGKRFHRLQREMDLQIRREGRRASVMLPVTPEGGVFGPVVMQMSEKKDPPRAGNVIQLFPERPPAEPNPADRPLSREELNWRTYRRVIAAQQLTHEFGTALLDYAAGVEHLVTHRRRVGKRDSGLEDHVRILREQLTEIRIQMQEFAELGRELEGYRLVAERFEERMADEFHAKRQVLRQVWSLRLVLEQCLDRAQGLIEGKQGFDEALEMVRGMGRELLGISSRGAVVLKRGVKPPALLPELRAEDAMTGMIHGILLREALRPSLSEVDANLLGSAEARLSPFSERAWDAQKVSAILQDMTPLDPNLMVQDRLMTEGPRDSRRSTVYLRHGGGPEAPFATWLGIYLPVLLAAEHGRLDLFYERYAPVIPQMPADLRRATRWAGQFLGFALNEGGSPSSWRRKIDDSVRPDPVLRALGKRVFARRLQDSRFVD
ncbi:MAG: hypothetical protein ACREP8_09440, partial [Candidatus Binatia bacterium]